MLKTHQLNGSSILQDDGCFGVWSTRVSRCNCIVRVDGTRIRRVRLLDDFTESQYLELHGENLQGFVVKIWVKAFSRKRKISVALILLIQKSGKVQLSEMTTVSCRYVSTTRAALSTPHISQRKHNSHHHVNHIFQREKTTHWCCQRFHHLNEFQARQRFRMKTKATQTHVPSPAIPSHDGSYTRALNTGPN